MTETPQPVYFLCDVSVHMGNERLALAQSLIAQLTADLLPMSSIRWGVEHYGTTEGSRSVLPLQRVGSADNFPAMRSTAAEPSFRKAADAMLRRMDAELAGFPAVRPPVVVVVTCGAFADSETELSAALAELVSRPARVLFAGIAAGKGTPLGRLTQAQPASDEFAVTREAEIAAVARDIIEAIRRLAAGAPSLRYARWVIGERDLGTGTFFGRTADAELFEVDGHRVYRRYLTAQPLEVLLDVAASRPQQPLLDRACWPLKVVVGDDPRVASGLLEPALPAEFTDIDGRGQAIPRSIALLRLDGSAPVPVAPGTVPADDVTRLRICAALAETVTLAHSSGIALGPSALESAVFRLEETRLVDCGEAGLRDPGQVGDLVWLAQFIEKCVSGLDFAGQDLLRRARSNSPAVVPPAAQWRAYLDQRALVLQGPPTVEAITVEPRFAPVGGQITVHWRTRHADEITLIGPDGTRTPVPPLVEGSAQVTVTQSGPVTLLLRNHAGEHLGQGPWVTVFELPRITSVPVPAAPPMPAQHTLNQVGDLIGSTWTMPAMDPPAAPQRPSLPSFPHDVSAWFFQRPEKPRKKWWRLPWT